MKRPRTHDPGRPVQINVRLHPAAHARLMHERIDRSLTQEELARRLIYDGLGLQHLPAVLSADASKN